jgi:VWFA-related protein
MMKCFSSTVFFAIFFFAFFLPTVSVHAQTPTGTPPDDVIKISTTLIQVDVTVTDKKGRIVTDLKPADFEVYENGKKQEITNFSFISVDSKSEPVKSPPAAKNSIPLPPVKLKAEQVRRTYALVVDDLGLDYASALWVKEALMKFVNEQMEEGDLVAILRTGSGIGALQSFTSDKRQLMAAINKIRWNSQSRSGISAFETIRPDFNQEIESRSKSGRKIEGSDATAAFVRELEEFRRENFSVGTLGALNYVISGMRDLPGRKAVMLFSEGFGISPRIIQALRILADLANRSSVLIYTIDPRGLQDPTFANAADDVSGMLPLDHPRVRDFTESQQSLQYLAHETGGFPFINQNNIDLGIRRVIADQSSYYLLGYQPDDDTFDPKKNKFNKLEVRVKHPDLKVRYRSGFFGVTDEKIQTVARTPHQQLADALVSPFGADEINIELYSIFYNDHQNRDFIRSLVHINAKDLTFAPDADGLYRAKFDVIAMIFDSNGAAAGNKINSVELTFTKERLAKIREKGMIYDLPVSVVKTGAYQFRVALRDSGNGKIGAASQFIEVPNLKKNKLTLSGFILENYTAEEWEKISFAQTKDAKDKSAFLDTTLRRFERGTILRYNYAVYNAKANKEQNPQLRTQMRLIRDGKVILEGRPTPFDASSQTDLQRLQASGAITLGSDLTPGNYILQVIAFDDVNGGKQRFATQFVEFEIVK